MKLLTDLPVSSEVIMSDYVPHTNSSLLVYVYRYDIIYLLSVSMDC